MNRKTQQAFAEFRSPKIDLRQLRHAVTAADFGSFRQAADACLIKQSTLSRSIRQLEHCVGVAIFERSSAGIRPTQAGREHEPASWKGVIDGWHRHHRSVPGDFHPLHRFRVRACLHRNRSIRL